VTTAELGFLGAIVLLASTVQSALGFGASLIIVSLGALRLPIAQLLPVLVPLSCVATTTIVVVDRAHVDRRLLLRRILPLMAPGVVLGGLLAHRLADDAARRAYGVVVVLLAAHALWTLLRPAAPDAGARPPSPPRASDAACVALAGLVHGVFATGGPLLVYVVDRLQLSPRVFRATLAGVWLTLNLLLTAGFAAAGRLDLGTLACSAALLPALGLGLALGHRVHTGLDRRTLRGLVLGLLLVAGVSLAR
jgi:uncharacterized membrane protein YfcA